MKGQYKTDQEEKGENIELFVVYTVAHYSAPITAYKKKTNCHGNRENIDQCTTQFDYSNPDNSVLKTQMGMFKPKIREE